MVTPAGRNVRGSLLFDHDAEETLRARWGITPRVADLSRSEVLVLAALARWPFGLRSARAVARTAGVSPTVAARVLERLRERGLVQHRRLLVAEGHAREVDNWSIEWRSPDWWRLAAAVARTPLPESAPHARAARPPRRVPRRFWHLFWDANPASVDLRRHSDYVVARVLEFGDRNAVAWLVASLPAEAFHSVARKSSTRLKPEVRRLADALARGLS